MNQENDPLFSRAVRAEKLTAIAPLTIRQTESLARDIQGLADLHGMEKSEYIRHLVIQDKKRQQEIWAARNTLFAGATECATDTAHDME
jgi:hypothetical protein